MTTAADIQRLAEKLQALGNNNADEGSLSDAGVFAYCSLCAVALAQLYPEPCHKVFCHTLLADITRDKDEQIRNSAFAILEGHGEDTMMPFAETLMAEPSLKSNPMAVIQDLLLLVLQDGVYDARSRFLLKHVAFVLRVKWSSLEETENKMASLLADPAQVAEVTDESAKRTKKRKWNRYLAIGAAAVGGGVLIGLTGGLAAPLVAAGAGAIIGGGAAAAIGTTAGVAIIGSLFGAAGAGLTGYKMRKRVGSLKHFDFVPLTPPVHNELTVCIAVGGWIDQDELDFFRPWQRLYVSQEQYIIKWEPKYLKEMGKALDYFMSFVKSAAITETLKMTVLSGILTAIAWPAALVTASSVIDNPWSVCANRATEGGKVLADALVSRQHGNRPVSLIGFSMGAKLIFSCLKDMAQRKKGVEGIVEDVYLLGAPISASKSDWEQLGRVVSGKIVNAYCRTDWFLKFMYRTTSASFSIAGLQAVEWEDRRMCNLDVTSIITGHRDYFKKMDELLPVLGVKMHEAPQPIHISLSGLSHGSSGPSTVHSSKSQSTDNLAAVAGSSTELANAQSADKTDADLTDVKVTDADLSDTKVTESDVRIADAEVTADTEHAP